MDPQIEATERKTASLARDSADKATASVSDVAKKTQEKAGEAAVAATGQVTTVARTAWSALAHRKMLAMGVGAGVTAVGAASYAAGRRAGRHS